MELMLASKYNEKRAKRLLDEHGFLYAQEKFDGARVYIKDGNVYTRNQKQIIILNDDFNNELDSVCFDNIILDGELLALDEEGNILPRQVGNGIINSAIKGNVGSKQQYKLMIFDCLEIGDESQAYKYRLNQAFNLAPLMGGKSIRFAHTKRVWSTDQIKELYNAHIEMGHEGIMIKSPGNVYAGKRVPDIMKLKEEKTADLKVIDIVLGNGKYEGMVGSLCCTTDDNRLLVSVGSGLTDEQRKLLPTNGTIIEVKYNRVIQDEHGNYSLFLPVFVGFRHDKDKANNLEELL